MQPPKSPLGNLEKDEILTVFCVVNGGSMLHPFSVDIGASQTIDCFKKLIKAEKSIQLAHIDADQLTLFRVDVPVDDKQDDPVNLAAIASKTFLHPSKCLSTIFPEGLSKNTIHVVVDYPCPDPENANCLELEVCVLPKAGRYFTWSTNMRTSTLTELRSAIASQFPELKMDTTTSLVQYKSFDDSTKTENIMSDEHLRTILRITTRNGRRRLVIGLVTPERPFSCYTLVDFNSLYGLTAAKYPELKDLPPCATIRSAQLDSLERKQALDRLHDEIETRICCLDVKEGAASFIQSFLIQAVAVFKNDLRLGEKRPIAGARGQGIVDFVVTSKADHSHVLGITRATQDKFEDSVAQNMVQLESMSRGQKRKLDDTTEHPTATTIYGIVTDAEVWHFVECKLKNTKDPLPVFGTSKLPGRVNYDSESRRDDIRRIFAHIIMLLQGAVDQIPNKRQRTLPSKKA